ncbi:MAG: hypothetical protein KUL79_14190 [Thauera sp.]|nr:hypothetical protein [Thauera sp.]
MPSSPSSPRNRFATFPDTPTARRNLSRLLRETTTVGYTSIARATVHDKSWVSRFLAGNGLISLSELLVWLDRCQLVLDKDAPDGVPQDGDKAMLERLESALRALDALASRTQARTHCERELMLSLIGLARIGLESLLQRYQPAAER